MALPAVWSERDPIVPAPRGTRSVSELTRVIWSIGMPRTFAGQHGEGGVVTLAVGAGAGEHAGGAVVVDLDGAELDVQPDRRRDLDVGGHADAELLGVAVGAPAGLLGPQAGVPGRLQRGIERLLVLARVVVGTRRRGEREAGPAPRKFIRRISAGSMPIWSAATSITRSISCVASGRPAPRYAPMVVLFVITVVALNRTFGMSYTPTDIIWVSIGRMAPMPG